MKTTVVIGVLAWLAAAGAQTVSSPELIVANTSLMTSPATPVSAAQDESGQTAYDRVCKVCHGEDGRGDAGPRLVPFSRAYDEVLGIVREGSGQMPPISTRQLSDQGVALIVKYLESLGR